MERVNKYDLVVMGSGSGGSVPTTKCNEAGWKVAVVDDRPFGGTCALRGCDPKKVLHGAAELYDWSERMKGKGISGDVSVDWPELMQFKRTFTEPVPDNKVQSLNKKDIDTYQGKAFFINEKQITVGDEILEGEKIVIATGSKSSPLPIQGEEYLIYSDQFLELDTLPETIVFVGGGYISFELAHIAARAGVKVHIIHRGKRPLENFDADLVDLLVKKSREIGIQVHLEHSVETIEKDHDTFVVQAKVNGELVSFPTDLVVHGAGRVPSLDLDLQKGNIASEKNGIVVNEYLQSVTNPRVYASGDVAATSGLPLTPVASMESHIVSSNLLKGNHKKVDYPPIPSVVFTVPKLASVGMTEEEAKKSGKNIEIKHQEVDGWFTYKRTNESYTSFKILVDQDEDRVVGAHLISEEADELINHFTTAIRFGISTKELKQTIYAYPTAASDIAHML